MNKDKSKNKSKISPWTFIGSLLLLSILAAFVYWAIILEYKTPWSQ